MRFALKSIPVLVIFGVTLAACGDVNKKYQEQAAITAQSTIEATNRDLTERAATMEQDLSVRQRFFQGVQGKYDGQFTDSFQMTFGTRLELNASLPPYTASRVRTEAEISNDLNNLFFNVQITHWTLDHNVTFGCTFISVHPDIASGRIVLSAPDCANSYVIYLQPQDANINLPTGLVARNNVIAAQGQQIANGLLSGTLNTVPQLTMTMKSTRQPEAYDFWLRKSL